MDVDLGIQITGLQLAQAIREKQPFANIIFFTSQEDCASNIINLHIAPIAYLSKYLDAKALKLELQDLLLFCANLHRLLTTLFLNPQQIQAKIPIGRPFLNRQKE